MVNVHVAARPVVVHIPQDFLNRDSPTSLFKDGTGSKLFQVLHTFAVGQHCEEPLDFLLQLDEANRPDISDEDKDRRVTNLKTEFVGSSAPRELNLSGLGALKIAEAKNTAELLAAFNGVRLEVEDSIYRSTYRNFQKKPNH